MNANSGHCTFTRCDEDWGQLGPAMKALPLADIYRRLGAPMMGTHAQNTGGGFHFEPMRITRSCGCAMI